MVMAHKNFMKSLRKIHLVKGEKMTFIICIIIWVIGGFTTLIGNIANNETWELIGVCEAGIGFLGVIAIIIYCYV